MAARAPSSLSGEIAAAFEWWRDAGVDGDFADEATDWLAEKAPAEAKDKAVADKPAEAPPRRAPMPEPPPQARAFVDNAALPADLAAFREWWLASDTLDAGGALPRIAPAGERGAELMVVVAQPEHDDRERLLSGPEGALLDGMLRAMGLSRERTYLAALLPRHDPVPDWPAIATRGLGEVLFHHIGIAAPERILLLGRNIPPLLGHDMAQAPAILREFNHEGRSIHAMGAGGLADMLRSATRRERFWRCWLEWTYGTESTD